jgi:anaerobic sulfite reductase subunit C
MDQVDYKALKKGGFMRQVQKDRFSLRLRVVGGQINSGQLQKVGEIAEKYGRGYIHMTSRQGIEIPFIALSDLDAVKDELASVGLQPGACGPRVRTVTACQGASVCPSGLIETSGLAAEMDARYFGRDLPHKFKIGITGCRNNCLKAEENDLGIKGGLYPLWREEECTYCGLCEAVCPAGAIRVEREKGTLSFAEAACVFCGKCFKSCPAGAWEGRNGYIISFGGMFGNEIRQGQHLLPVLYEKEQLFSAVDTAIRFFEAYGQAGERLALTLERVGADILKKMLAEVVA